MNIYIVLYSLLSSYLGAAFEIPPYDVKLDSGARGSYPLQHKFVSSKLRQPQVNFLQWSPECDDGLYYFLAPRGWKVAEPGPMILDVDGTLVWRETFSNEFGGQAYDFKVQKYRGEDYLTFWLGDDTVRGHGAGSFFMLNSSYDIAYQIRAAGNMPADLHEFVITPEGTALISIFQVVKADVRPLGRKFQDLWNQAIWDCIIQEIEISTGELLFQWRASEHVNMTTTYSGLDSWSDAGTQANPFDWVHVNSVQKDELGNYLVSARGLHAILYIDGRTKEIIWTLGGKANDFEDHSDGYALNFAWQHDARFVPLRAFPETYVGPSESEGVTTRLLTMFDNAALDWDYSFGLPYSRALVLEISYLTPGAKVGGRLPTTESRNIKQRDSNSDIPQIPLSDQDLEKVRSINGTNPSYTVRIVKQYINPKRVLSSTQGSAQLVKLSNEKDPKIFVGYGINAVITEFSSNGTALCDMHFGPSVSWETGNVQSYRAFKQKWVGRPQKPPSMILRGQRVFISWNGATECRTWLLQASDDLQAGNWEEMSQVEKHGFETLIDLSTLENPVHQKYLRITALDVNGQQLEHGISDVVARGFLNMILAQHFGTSSNASLVFLFSGAGAAMWCLYKIGRRKGTKGRIASPHTAALLLQRPID